MCRCHFFFYYNIAGGWICSLVGGVKAGESEVRVGLSYMVSLRPPSIKNRKEASLALFLFAHVQDSIRM